MVLKLPPGWATRTQTLAVLGSTDGSSYTTLSARPAYTFDPATGNTVIDQPARRRPPLRAADLTANTGWPAAQLSELEVYGGGGTTPRRRRPPRRATDPAAQREPGRAGRPVTETSHADVYAPANTVDGNANTYWESANNAFPQSLTGGPRRSDRRCRRVVLKLPPATAWATRTQTLSVLGSTDGSRSPPSGVRRLHLQPGHRQHA